MADRSELWLTRSTRLWLTALLLALAGAGAFSFLLHVSSVWMALFTVVQFALPLVVVLSPKAAAKLGCPIHV